MVEQPISDSAICAMRARKKDAQRILRDRELCAELVQRFRAGMSYLGIVIDMGGPNTLGMKDDLSDEEIGRVLREVKQELMTACQSKKHASAVHVASAQINEEALSAGRKEWMEEQGFIVWSSEEHEYFMKLKRRKSMRRYGKKCVRLHHPKIAAAMNEHFQTDKFTPVQTQRHLQDTDKKLQQGRRRRIRARRNGNGEQD